MNSITTSIFGICFIFIMSSLGSAIIFFVKKDLSEKWQVFLNSLAGGIMLASSIWSLIIPSIDTTIGYGVFNFLPAVVGILLGALFMYLLDLIIKRSQKKGVSSGRGLNRNKRMFIALSLHNIPEGLSVGVAFGSALALGTEASLVMALSLAIGIGIQNFPEGLAVSLPMYECTKSKNKAFFYGVFSGFLEPISALLGISLASIFTFLLPWLLAFAAGTMIYTLINELLPETQGGRYKLLGTWGFLAGFLIMMILDVAFAG